MHRMSVVILSGPWHLDPWYTLEPNVSFASHVSSGEMRYLRLRRAVRRVDKDTLVRMVNVGDYFPAITGGANYAHVIVFVYLWVVTYGIT